MTASEIVGGITLQALVALLWLAALGGCAIGALIGYVAGRGEERRRWQRRAASTWPRPHTWAVPEPMSAAMVNDLTALRYWPPDLAVPPREPGV